MDEFRVFMRANADKILFGLWALWFLTLFLDAPGQKLHHEKILDFDNYDGSEYIYMVGNQYFTIAAIEKDGMHEKVREIALYNINKTIYNTQSIHGFDDVIRESILKKLSKEMVLQWSAQNRARSSQDAESSSKFELSWFLGLHLNPTKRWSAHVGVFDSTEDKRNVIFPVLFCTGKQTKNNANQNHEQMAG